MNPVRSIFIENLKKNNSQISCFHFTGPDPDDTLDEKFVDASGMFSLNGYTRELTNIDPVLYVWHDCQDAQTPCQRKIKFVIPQKFIIGDVPKDDQWVDFGTINLESTFAEEKRECIH